MAEGTARPGLHASGTPSEPHAVKPPTTPDHL